MVHIYYHIYSTEGVEDIIDEQLKLIEDNFKFPYILNVGISIANDNTSTSNIIDRFYTFDKPNYRIRDIRANDNEFVTLDLIEKDINKFGNSDYILYLHTKGASKKDDSKINNIKTWRNVMNYFNIERVLDVFKLFDKTSYNTYGVFYQNVSGFGIIYSGNFWWSKADYIKTIKYNNFKKKNRFHAEKLISSGDNWKPYSAYNVSQKNLYEIEFKKEDYII